MGTTHLLQFPISATATSPPLPLLLINHYNPLYQNPTTSGSRFSKSTRCRSTGYGTRGGGPQSDSNAEKTVRAQRFKFNLDDKYVTSDDDDGDGGFGFRSGAKKRVWWSDDSMDTDDDEEGFGVLEESIDMSWIIKVLNAFGWMLPAIGISLLLGTGPNAFFMALVLPIAQSAISLATDTFWGRSKGSSPKPKRRTRKKPFARAASDIGMSEDKEDVVSGKVRENYQTWGAGAGAGAGNDRSNKTRNRRAASFGGWDELDKRVGVGTYKAPKQAPTQKAANEPRRQKKGKLSRRFRSRETPLLLRLLIAVFPFLGSWTKLL